MAFEWTEEMKTGNETIDSEHKQLIRAINALLDACSEGRGRQVLNKAVMFLLDYTNNHFKHEEMLQIEYKYPHYQSHKNFHQSYLEEIRQLAGKLGSEGATIAMLGEVNAKASVLINHIKTMDTSLAKFIAENS